MVEVAAAAATTTTKICTIRRSFGINTRMSALVAFAVAAEVATTRSAEVNMTEAQKGMSAQRAHLVETLQSYTFRCPVAQLPIAGSCAGSSIF
jgi:hypothetical protein